MTDIQRYLLENAATMPEEALKNVLQQLGGVVAKVMLSREELQAKAKDILATAETPIDDSLRIKKELEAKRAQIKRDIVFLGAKRFYSR